MRSYITLNKKDPRYQKYLWGTFSEVEYAVPVESLNKTPVKDVTTFLVDKKTNFKKPNAFIVFLSLIKWNYFIFLFVPLYLVISKNVLYERFFDPLSLLLATLSACFLFAGLNIRNDVIDHVTGYDQIVYTGKIKPIAKGWVSAYEAVSLSWMCIGLSFIISIPVFKRQPESIRVAGIVLILFLLGNFLRKNTYKFKYFSEFILFLLFGPALMSGYQVALGSGVDTEILALGTLWGFAVLFLFYLGQFKYLFETSRAGIVNTITKKGFEGSKKFLILWWSVFIVLWALFHKFYASIYWAWFGSAVLIFWSFPTFIRIASSRSPMGSELESVYKVGIRNFGLVVMLMLTQSTYYLVNYIRWKF